MIAEGPAGTLVFAETRGNNIGFITTGIGLFGMAGRIAEVPIPTPNSQPIGVTLGADRAIWFAESTGNKIGRLSLGPDVEEGLKAIFSRTRGRGAR